MFAPYSPPSTQKAKPQGYLDIPDGEDVARKLWIVAKPTGLLGLGISTADVLLYSRPQGYAATLGRYAYFTLPVMGMGAAFVIASNLLANARKSDDNLNWAAGGYAAGACFGKWRGSVIGGIVVGTVLAAAAALKKESLRKGWDLTPMGGPMAHGGLRSVRHDWSLCKDPKDKAKLQ